MNTEWIKDLKVGDTVAVIKTFYTRRYYELVTVEKITPTGRLNLSNGSKYYSNGRVIGDTTQLNRMVPMTDEVRESAERTMLHSKIKYHQFCDKLSSDRLRLLLEWQEELKND